MPADVAMHNFHQLNETNSCWNTENMNGYMNLIGPNDRNQGIQVKVYRTGVEHFAVIYPQKKVCRPHGVLNLKNTSIERYRDEGFTIRHKGFDRTLTFVVDNKKELDFWISAFTPRSNYSLVHQSLPIVEEEEI